MIWTKPPWLCSTLIFRGVDFCLSNSHPVSHRPGSKNVPCRCQRSFLVTSVRSCENTTAIQRCWLWNITCGDFSGQGHKINVVQKLDGSNDFCWISLVFFCSGWTLPKNFLCFFRGVNSALFLGFQQKAPRLDTWGTWSNLTSLWLVDG